MMKPDFSGDGALDRRKFLAAGIGGLIVASLPRALSGKTRLVTRTVPVMGTIAEIKVVHDDVQRAERAIDAALDELYAVDRTMTRYSRHSEVGRANLDAARHPVVLGAATATVVERALHWAEHTDGSFDPCLGEVCQLWDVEHRRVPPAAGEVRHFASEGLFRQIDLDRRSGERVVYFRSTDVALDLGGIGKGWAVDRAVDALRAHGIRDAVVNAGGDLYAMGHSESGDPWEIGVQSPTDPHATVATFKLTDAAVATSGDYRRFFDYHGRRYHHIMDPRTGAPRVTREHSVSVYASNCIDADAGATAVFGYDPVRAQSLLAGAAPDARLIHSI